MYASKMNELPESAFLIKLGLLIDSGSFRNVWLTIDASLPSKDAFWLKKIVDNSEHKYFCPEIIENILDAEV